MYNCLVIVESSGKTKTINKILGPKYKVVASYGHVRDLPPSGLNIDLKTFDGNYEIIKSKQNIVSELRSKLKNVEKIYICTDPDREGEFIAFSLAEILGLDVAKTPRVTFNEITKKAITEAFKNPRKIDMDLVNAQQARRFLDRIVGYKLTGVLYEKILRGLTGGRVQSVAVRILSEREREIQKFKTEEYWTVKGDFKARKISFSAELREISKKKVVASAKDMGSRKNKLHIKDRAASDKVVDNCMNSGDRIREYTVLAYKQSNSSDRAPPPFSTSTLQQAASTRLGFDASRTMRVAQKLYEGIEVRGEQQGLITYMRTDSFNVSNDARYASKDIIEKDYGKEYYPDKPNFYKSRKGSQQAHECVRPTYFDLYPRVVRPSLSTEQFRLYELIWNRFFASQMAPARYKSTICDLDSGGQVVFRATGRIRTFDGWTKVYDIDSKDTTLPGMYEGQKVSISKAVGEQHFTQPPPRYNDASLVKKMEAEGIGRPSTYASIIKVIQDRGYAVKEGKGGKAPLKATHLGITVTESLIDHFSMMDIGFTRDMEEQLDEVEEGKVEYKKLLCKFWKEFQGELKAAKKGMPSTKKGKPSKYKCPKCKSTMFQRLSQFGVFFKCTKEDCEYIMDGREDGTPEERKEDNPTGIKCDLCGEDVVLAKGRFGAFLCCANYNKKIEKVVKGKKKKVPTCDFTINIGKKGHPRRRLIPVGTSVKCKDCKRPMVIRVASRKRLPEPFLGCSGFPKCRGLAPLPDSLDKKGEKLMETFRANRKKDEGDLMILQKFILDHSIEL